MNTVDYNPFKNLVDDLNYQIFSFMDIKTLNYCSQVDKKFSALLANNNYFWKYVLPDANEQTVSSLDSMNIRIISFIGKYLNSDKVYDFNVKFPFNPDYKIYFKFGPTEHGERKGISDIIPDVKESLFYVIKHEEEMTQEPSSSASGRGRFFMAKVKLPNSIDSGKLLSIFFRAEHYCFGRNNTPSEDDNNFFGINN